MSPSGLVVIDKPAGMTSHDVVARVRRALGTRKVGHAGTLDPMATGVLIVGVGRATRLLGHLAGRDKEYVATIRLGASTVTDDAEGPVSSRAAAEQVQALDELDIREALARQVGTIEQRPSAVSAIKVDGRRSHERVRSGENVELPARRVVVFAIDVTQIRWTPEWVDVDVRVSCGTGTYVRAIARDTGESLGVGGHLTALRRTRVGPFALEQAVDLSDVAAASIMPMEEVARLCFPIWQVDDPSADAVRHGRRIPWMGPAAAGVVAVVDPAGAFLALAVDDDGTARYSAVLA